MQHQLTKEITHFPPQEVGPPQSKLSPGEELISFVEITPSHHYLLGEFLSIVALMTNDDG